VFTFWFETCRRTPSSSGRRYPVLWNPILVGKSSTHTLTHSRVEIYDLQVRQSQNDNKINRTFAWYLASFCLPVICANAMQFVGPTFEPVAELPYFGLRFFWRSGSRDPRKKSTWNWYTCRQVSREFYIFNCRASNAEFPISMAIAIDLYLVLYSHTRQLARYVRTPRRISLVWSCGNVSGMMATKTRHTKHKRP